MVRRAVDLPDTGKGGLLLLSTGKVHRQGGFAFAVQPHREVRPESGLVGIVEHIVVNKRGGLWLRLDHAHP